MSYDFPDFLHCVEPSKVSDVIALNAASLTRMTAVVLPGMKERGRGCVVNISSGVAAALPASPLLSVYAATKAFVDTLSVSLAAEYAHFGIKVQVRTGAVGGRLHTWQGGKGLTSCRPYGRGAVPTCGNNELMHSSPRALACRLYTLLCACSRKRPAS